MTHTYGGISFTSILYYPVLKVSTSLAAVRSFQPVLRIPLGLPRSHRSKECKSYYKLRHRWLNGRCHYRESGLPAKSRLGQSQTLLQSYEDTIITANEDATLRAWNIKAQTESLLARYDLRVDVIVEAFPTSLAIDRSLEEGKLNVAVGLSNGSVSLYVFDLEKHQFIPLQNYSIHDHRRVSALSLTQSYLISMDESQTLLLYQLPSTLSFASGYANLTPIASYKSNTVQEPISLSSRVTRGGVLISVAYFHPTYLSGWTIGLQEIEMTTEGTIVQSQSRVGAPTSVTTTIVNEPWPRIGKASSRQSTMSYEHLSPTGTKPDAISYSYPFLLAAHSDNTLSVYLVCSADKRAKISPGQRLWGHTSAIIGAHIDKHGKAVTVARGGDVRVWELGGLQSPFSRKPFLDPSTGIQIQPEADSTSDPSRQSLIKSVATPTRAMGYYGERLSSGDDTASAHRSTGSAWVHFNEERLAVLQDGTGSQTLIVYDFS